MSINATDELIYTVKFEPDLKSIQELKDSLDKALPKDLLDALRELTKEGKKQAKTAKEQESALKDLRKELKEKQEALANLNREVKIGTEESDKSITAQRELGGAIGYLKQQIQEANSGFITQNQILETTPSTIAELKEQTRALGIAINNTNYVKNNEQLKNLQKRYTENNAKLKEFDATIGNHQRNVGDYENSIRGAANAIAILQGPLGPIAGRINAAATALARFEKTALAGGVASRFLAVGIKMIWAVAAPLALVVLSLANYFKNTEKGAQTFRVIMAVLGTVLAKIRDVTIDLGESLVNAFTSPKDALRSLWNGTTNFLQDFGRRIKAIPQDFGRRIKAIPDLFVGAFNLAIANLELFGAQFKLVLSKIPLLGAGIDTSKAQKNVGIAYKNIEKGALQISDAMNEMFKDNVFSNMIGSLSEFVVEVADAATEAGELEKRMNAVLVNERDINEERAKQNLALAIARKEARDLDKDTEERLRLLRQERDGELKVLERELSNERERLEIMQAQLDLTKSSEEEIKAVSDQVVKVAGLEEESNKRQMSFANDITAVERQLREEQLRRARERFREIESERNFEFKKEIEFLQRRNSSRAVAERQLRSLQTDSERKKNELREVYEKEYLNLKFSEEESPGMAKKKAEIEVEEQIFDAKMRLLDTEKNARMKTLTTIADLTGAINGVIFKNNKELAIAQTLINTRAAVMAAFKDTDGNLLIRLAAASTAALHGLQQLRDIRKTRLKGGGGGSISVPSQQGKTSFGLVDVGTNDAVAGAVAGQIGNMGQMFQPSIILEGEFDPSFLAVKVRQGNNQISSRSVVQ